MKYFRTKSIYEIALYVFFTTLITYDLGSQIPLSQNTNFYINKTKNQIVYISSIDGLNIYDGQKVKTYRPGASSNMYGRNIQSNFFEDSLANVWFCTYEALHVHYPHIDSIEYIFLEDDIGEELKSDYRVFGLQEDKLWVQAGQYIFLFDIYSKQVLKRTKHDLSNHFNHTFSIVENKIQIVSANYREIRLSIFNENGKLEKQNAFEIDAFSNLHFEKESYWVGTKDGKVLLIDLTDNTIVKDIRISDKSITGLAILENELLINTSSGQTWRFHMITEEKNQLRFPKIETLNLDRPVFSPPYIDQNNILWFGVDGYGVVKQDLSSKYFKKWLLNDQQNFVSGIHEYEDKFLVTTRNNGIHLYNNRFEILRHYNELPFRYGDFNVSSGTIVHNKFVFVSNLNGYVLDLESSAIVLESEIGECDKLESNSGNQIFAIKNNKAVYKIYDNYEFTSKEIIPALEFENKYVNSFQVLNDSIAIVGVNDEYFKVINIKEKTVINNSTLGANGKILSTLDGENNYFSTNYGLYELDNKFTIKEKVIDQDGFLDGTLYSVYEDASNNLWLSSNSGILHYDINDNKCIQFVESDGVQGSEFNSHAHLQKVDGTILFGGTNGINVFHPDSIKLSEYKTPVYISSILVNDEDYDFEYASNYTEEMEMPYENNTLSIKFHGIDHSDIETVDLKYMLEGEDDAWVELDKNDGFARYSNLEAGQYTFKALATNSDGVWSNKLKEIEISIRPPWWQTWWFRIAVLAAGGILIWLGFRQYYKRQLEKRDLALREQKLKLDKQTVLQAERNRIASEMHDDLGGGLTTIKFISQRALRKIKDPDDQELLEKISNQSTDLVNNMSEIIWAMNSGFDNLESLIGYVRRYATAYLNDYDIKLRFESQGETAGIAISGEKRRHIFLVVKEALHNVVKHAKAEQVDIKIKVSENLCVIIRDYGQGFTGERNAFGNGVKNMEERIAEVDGVISIVDKQGLELKITVPL